MILAVGCEYAPVVNWADILSAPVAPSNYKKPEAIDGYIEKQLAKLRGGEAAVHPVVGAIVRAVIINGDKQVVYQDEGEHVGACALLLLTGHLAQTSPEIGPPIFGLKLQRMLRLMALDLAMTKGEIPTKAQWAVGLDPRVRYNQHVIDPISVLFGSSDTDPWAVARRTGYVFQEGQGLDTALGMAEFALALGGLLGLGG